MPSQKNAKVELSGALEDVIMAPDYLFEAPYTASVRAKLGDYDWIIKVADFGLDRLTTKMQEVEEYLGSRGAKPEVRGEHKNLENKEVEFPAVQAKFERTDSGKFRISFYRMYGDQVGQYPDLSETLAREAMWEKYRMVLDGQDLHELPKKFPWYGQVYWVRGRPTGKTDDDGNPTYFKDIVRIVPAED